MNRATKYLHEILGTTTKIAMSVKIIAILLFMLCVWMSIHYLLYHFTKAHITSQPFDYNGMLVGFFSLLVTLLVGWNIYSTINAKSELEKAKEEYASEIQQIKDDIKDLQDKRQKQSIQQAKEDGIEEERNRLGKLVNLALPKEIIEYVEQDVVMRETKLHDWFWNTIDEYKSLKQIWEEYIRAKERYPKKVAYINGRQATDEEAKKLLLQIREEKFSMFDSYRQLRDQADKENPLV